MIGVKAVDFNPSAVICNPRGNHINYVWMGETDPSPNVAPSTLSVIELLEPDIPISSGFMIKRNCELRFSVIDIFNMMKISFRNIYNLTCIDSKGIVASSWTEDRHKSST